jgi:hypothetical protein
MAYGDPLDETTPADSDFTGQGDDRIREFKRAIRQRLASFFSNIDVDPMVPKNGSIPAASLVAESVTAAQLAASAVGTAEIADGAITKAKLAAGVDIPPDDTISTIKLQDLSVTTAKLADESVTAGKLAPGVGGIPDGSIGRDQLAGPTKDHLLYVQKGRFTYPAGFSLDTGSTNTLITISVDTNDVVGPDVMVILNPRHVDPDVGVDAWYRHLVFQGCVQIIAGNPSPRLIIRVQNNDGAPVDVSGKSIDWMVVQIYSGGGAGWP